MGQNILKMLLLCFCTPERSPVSEVFVKLMVLLRQTLCSDLSAV